MLEVLIVSEYIQNNDDNALKPAHIKFFVMQKCSHTKQITAVTEEQICRIRNNAKENRTKEFSLQSFVSFLLR